MASSNDADTDNIVRKVADSLVDAKDIENVGRQFGFNYEKVQRYIQMNYRDQTISSNGTLKMLHDGLEKKKGNIKFVLKKALNQAGLVRLAEEVETMGSSEDAESRRDDNSAGQSTPAQAPGIRQGNSSIIIHGNMKGVSISGQVLNLGSSSEGRRDGLEGASIDQSESTINVQGNVEGGSLTGQAVTTGSSSRDEASGRKRKQGGGDQSAKNADKGMSEPWMTMYRACVNKSTETIISSLGIIVFGLISRYLEVPWMSENERVLLGIGILGIVVLWIFEVFRLWGQKQK